MQLIAWNGDYVSIQQAAPELIRVMTFTRISVTSKSLNAYPDKPKGEWQGEEIENLNYLLIEKDS